MCGVTRITTSRNEGITARRLHLSNHTFYVIIVILLPPFSSRMPRNSSLIPLPCWTESGHSNQRTTSVPSTPPTPPEERKEHLNHPFRRLSCLQALIQVSELWVVLGFCCRLRCLIAMVNRSIQFYNIIFHSCPFFTACNLLDEWH